MATYVLQALIVSAIAVCYVSGQQLSKRDTDILLRIFNRVSDDVSGKCNSKFVAAFPGSNFDNDAAVDNLCNYARDQKATLTSVNSCTATEANKIINVICDLVTESNQERANRLIVYSGQVYPKLTKTCRDEADRTAQASTLSTWYEFEQFCKHIEKTYKTSFEKQCPNDNYDDLKEAICGASGVFCGLLTLALGLVATFFIKL